MNTIRYTILAFVISFSCARNQSQKDEYNDITISPIAINLDTSSGYIQDPISGDSIYPILLRNGDTLQTGKPILYQENYQYVDSLPPTAKVKLKSPQISFINQNIFPYQANNIITVDSSMYKKMPFGTDIPENERYVVNKIGDTIHTGVPFKIVGSVKPALLPAINKTMPPQVKENAAATIQIFDVDQGIGASYITAYTQDIYNNIWLATDGGGISRFDGNTFFQYTEKTGLLSNTVKALFNDSKGNIWIATHTKGLSKFDGQNFTNYTELEGMPGNKFLSVKEDSKGNLWFGLSEVGLLKYDGENFTVYTKKEGLSGNTVNGIIEDKEGNMWFATNGTGACMFDGECFTRFAISSSTGGGSMMCIETDSVGNIWFGSEVGGASFFDGKKITIINANDGLGSNNVKCLQRTKNNLMVIGTTGGGFSIFDTKNITTFGENEGLSNGLIEDIFEDEGGKIWLATYGGGAIKFDINSFYHYTDKQGLPQRFVMSSAIDSLGNMWVGTLGGGLSYMDDKSIITYTTNNGLPNSFIRSIKVDKTGCIWVSCWGDGVVKLKGNELEYYNQQNGLTDPVIYSIYEDQKGNIWFGGAYKGMTKFNGQKFNYYNNDNGFGSSIVYGFAEDKKQNLWIATESAGLVKFDGNYFTHFTKKEGLGSNTVYCVFIDHLEHIWLGTYGAGLVKFDGKKFTSFTDKQGLTNNVVWSIIEDSQNRIWAGTEKGLNCLVQDSLQSDKYIIHTFEKNEGLIGLDFFSNQVLQDFNNNIWWGTGKSFEKLNLDKFQFSSTKLSPQLNDIEINGQRVDFRNIADSLKSAIQFDSVKPYYNCPVNLLLDAEYNHLTFQFSAIDWFNPNKILYQYKLEGLDDNWSELNKKTYAEYRNLPSGNFVFKVRAIGQSNQWSTTFEFSFTILPPWYQTWWAYMLYFLMLVFIVYLIIRWRTAQLKQRQRELEQDIEKATYEIRLQKEQVEEAHKEITDSINYAERLQRSLMSSKKLLSQNLGEYFIYFNPKEAVSGDFYWSSQLQNNNFALVCADSTGHGVPGAIMSMMNMNSLKEAVKEGFNSSNEILDYTRKTIIQTLANDGSAEGGKDGMDAALLIFNKNKSKLEFSLANNPLWIVRSSTSSDQMTSSDHTTNSESKVELIEFKPDKMPVGKHDKQNIAFSKNEIELQKGDLIYVFTDGFADQFGGEKGKKFKYASLKELLLSIAEKSMEEQQKILSKTFENWRGSLEQVDDVCVIGVRV